MLRKIKKEIANVCFICFIFDTVFHRILDFITRLDIYPGLFFSLFVACLFHLRTHLFLSAFVYLFLLWILNRAMVSNVSLDWESSATMARLIE